jgi:hypothetical protein
MIVTVPRPSAIAATTAGGFTRRILAAVLTALVVFTGAARAGTDADDDVEQAIASARGRAAAGDAVAQFSLGSLAYFGSDDTAVAIDWFRRAAAQEYPPAEFQMGLMYDFGFGVAADEEAALAWYRRAAQHGSAAGARAVGDFYRRGRGVVADPEEAARWYRDGAERDDLRAQYQLGQMYIDGTGVKRDYVSAYVWFDVAAGQTPLIDNQKALLELRNIAAARMTEEQRAEAARRAAAWKPVVSPVR